MASTEDGSTDVFVSYSRSDGAFARQLVTALASREKTCRDVAAFARTAMTSGRLGLPVRPRASARSGNWLHGVHVLHWQQPYAALVGRGDG